MLLIKVEETPVHSCYTLVGFSLITILYVFSLPCILYRLNGLLLAEKLRCQVAAEMGLGKITLFPG